MEITPNELTLLNDLRDRVAGNAAEKGFIAQLVEGLTPEQVEGPLGRRLKAAVYTANAHGEISEFWEAYRAGTLDKLCDKSEKMIAAGIEPLTCAEEEIADILIRALDTAKAFGVDVARAVALKHAYNRTRPALHGGKHA